MEEYFKKNGPDALKIWIFTLGVENLKEDFDQQRADRLRKMINDYLPILRHNSSEENYLHAKSLRDSIPIKKKIPKHVPLNLSVERVWLCQLAINQLKENPNQEKAKSLMAWFYPASDYSRHILPDVRGKYVILLKELNRLITE